jgi:hypothetical protein
MELADMQASGACPINWGAGSTPALGTFQRVKIKKYFKK